MTCLGHAELGSGRSRADTQVRASALDQRQDGSASLGPTAGPCWAARRQDKGFGVSLGWGPCVIHKDTALQCLTASLWSPRRKPGGWMESEARGEGGSARLWTQHHLVRTASGLTGVRALQPMIWELGWPGPTWAGYPRSPASVTAYPV